MGSAMKKMCGFDPVLDSCRHDHYDVCQFLCIRHLPDYILSYFGL